ncbi:MAG: outer membrane lipoprotein carrier protein LolA [Bacillati bacterium ANGP1]|uniref:Outer membrane lipoprotein carrier protein LolA n=1 Tax=Candidatus Segetimicrobium genomatis TaxID=2569760 RepID=A0A537JWL3_9BACT|nr:MAG: outer membrane lipoprotein carrier protein LolA [Terrabacteria group bacterium ANGP1]
MTGRVLVRGAGAVLFVLAAGALNAGAQLLPVPPSRILQMALEAPRLVDYEGTKVITVLRGDRTETITVAEAHKRPERMRLEYVSPEDLAGRLIVDDGATAWHYEPRLNMAFEGPTLGGQLLSRDRTLLLRNYGVTDLGVEDVIGRQAYVIALVPHHPGVQRRLWVDRATGTILRSEELDPSRGVILSAYFSRVSFSLNLPEAYFEFRMPAGARAFRMFTTEAGTMSPAALQRRVGFPVLIPPVLPEGYTFRGGAVSRFGSLTSVYLRYSNGGNLISFFEAPAGSIGWPSAGRAIAVGGRPARFVDLGYFRVLIWEQGRLRVTAVGTVPTETMVTAAGQIAAGREQALVQDVSRQIESDPATVQRLRGEGLTFPEVARTVTLAHRLGTDLGTTIRFVRGSLSASDLAGRLGMPQEMLQQTVQQTARETSTSSSPFLSSPR